MDTTQTKLKQISQKTILADILKGVPTRFERLVDHIGFALNDGKWAEVRHHLSCLQSQLRDAEELIGRRLDPKTKETI